MDITVFKRGTSTHSGNITNGRVVFLTHRSTAAGLLFDLKARLEPVGALSLEYPDLMYGEFQYN